MIIDYLLIGMKVREIRLSAKFTQEMLAKLSDSSPIYIYIYIYIEHRKIHTAYHQFQSMVYR